MTSGSIAPSTSNFGLGTSGNKWGDLYTSSITDSGTAVTISNPLTVSNSTASSSTTTGAVVVAGGIGAGGTSYLSALNCSTFASDTITDNGAGVTITGVIFSSTIEPSIAGASSIGTYSAYYTNMYTIGLTTNTLAS